MGEDCKDLRDADMGKPMCKHTHTHTLLTQSATLWNLSECTCVAKSKFLIGCGCAETNPDNNMSTKTHLSCGI